MEQLPSQPQQNTNTTQPQGSIQQPVQSKVPSATQNVPLTQILKEPPSSQTAGRNTRVTKLIKGKTFLNIFPGEGTWGTLAKLMFGLVTILGILLVIVAILIATKLDTQIFKLKLEGTVLDQLDSSPVADASVVLNGERVAVTDVDGKFTIDNLELGDINVQISNTGYENLSANVSISRSLFTDYTTEQTFYMENTEVGTVQVRLIADNETYVFSNDLLTIDSELFESESNGYYNSGKLAIGTYILEYESDNYMDFKQEIEIAKGVNRVEDITLTPAGTIAGELTSYIDEQPVTDALIQVENVAPEDIITNSNTFSIDNLEIGGTYTIRITSEGYLTRDYSLEIKQGINQISNLKMVEAGGAYFINTSTGDSTPQIYFTEYDGDNQKRISSINENLRPQELYFNSITNELYFLSDVDQVASTLGGRTQVAYKINLEQNTLTRLTTNGSDIGILVPNFKINKLVNVTEVNNISDSRRIILMDLNGDNRKTLVEYDEAQIFQAMLSDNGEYLYYTVYNIETDEYGLYRMQTATNASGLVSSDNNIKIWSIAPEGDKVIFTSQANEDANIVLKLYNLDNSEVRTLMANATGSDYQFLDGSDNIIVYWDRKNNRDNLYSYQIEQNKTDQLTNLGFDDELEFIYQQNRYIFYKTERGLYVIDYVNPVTFKQVSSEEEIINPTVEFIDEE